MSHTIERQTEIENPNGTSFSISTVFIYGDYETMVFDKIGEYVEESHSKDKEEAMKQHDNFVLEYTQKIKKPVNLTAKYLELAKDLKTAADEARQLGHTEDGGTCNFDSLELTLPRYNENLTIAAFKAAGLGGFKTKIFRTAVYIISPPVSRQANARTRQAEKMRDIMKSLGYQASVYYQMD